MLHERRQQRTSERDEALRFQLESSRVRGGLEALVLADRQGIVVACAGDAGICEELGAIAPLLSRAVMGMPLPPLLRGGEVVVRPLTLYGQDLYLACVGGGVARDALMSNSVSGVQRILASN